MKMIHSFVVLLYSIAVLQFLASNNMLREVQNYTLLLLPFIVFGIVRYIKHSRTKSELYIKSILVLFTLSMFSCQDPKMEKQYYRAYTKKKVLLTVAITKAERDMYNLRDTVQLIRVTSAQEWSQNRPPFKLLNSTDRKDTTYRRGSLVIEQVVATFN